MLRTDIIGPACVTEMRFPPVFSPVIRLSGEAFARATELAAGGAEPGTLVWIDRRGRLDCAVVLAPERPLDEALPVIQVGLLALVDALGSLGPPEVPITIAPPDRLLVNEGLVGGVRIAAENADPPAWMVLGATVDVEGNPYDTEPGLNIDRTALCEEGFGEVTTPELVQSYAHHLLNWMSRWEEDGQTVIDPDWRKRSMDHPAGPDPRICLKGPTWQL
jgi:BirA family transcriptional regulator, biotin operon repressor / biotin---[acetyl-CoA-carboxylase] ligase